MNQNRISIGFDGSRRLYLPGDILSGEYGLDAPHDADPKAAEVSVLWYTEGQGDEDLAVHYFERHDASGREPIDLRMPQRFRTCLPNSPLSYEGVIVKVRWCVRVRLFLSRGKELVAERPFVLGHVPPARCVPKGRSDGPAEPASNAGRAEKKSITGG